MCLFSAVEGGCAIAPDANGNVVIPDTWTEIGDSAFYGCTALTTITFSSGSGLTRIGLDAFSQAGLIAITIPDKITVIGDSAFKFCSALTEVKFGSGSRLTTIDSSAFFGTGFTAINIPDTVTVIGNFAFQQLGLITLTIPDSVTDIGSGAFQYCIAFTTVAFGSGSHLTSIGTNAFFYTGINTCVIPPDSGGNVVIPADWTTIPLLAFSSCANLKTVTFASGSQLTYIALKRSC